MNRFFTESIDAANMTAKVTGDDVKHISQVLRLTMGDRVTLCDGRGTDYLAEISEVTKHEAAFRLIEAKAALTEPKTRVTLFQGLPKAGKLETIIQKCVELGIYEITPFLAKRSVSRPDKKEFAKKLERYSRVSLEAAKQSRRGVIPEVTGLATLAEVDFSRFDLVIAPYEDEHTLSLKQALREAPDAMSIAVVIGPEGGFDMDETALLQEAGAKCATLGRRILRTETAGMAALAMIMYEMGEME